MTCKDCKHWEPVTPPPEPEYGACNAPSRPWDTPERVAECSHFSACMGRDEGRGCKAFEVGLEAKP